MTDSRAALAAERLRNQRLAGPPFERAADVVRHLVAVQAQDYPGARWSIGLRARGVTEADVDEALADGTLLRTHVLRETWHLVCREDIRWLLELTAPRVQARSAAAYRRFDLAPELLAETDALLRDTLAAQGPLTRAQLASVLREHGIEADGPRLGYVFIHAELGQLIASGPMSGKQHTYALLEGRVPAAPRGRGLEELARRYVASHGPVTAKDFAWWSSQTVSAASQALVGAGLSRTETGGRAYWSAGPAGDAPTEGAVLLPAYDEYVIGYSESRDVLDVRGLLRNTPPGWLVFSHAIVVDGQAVGHWRRAPKGEGVELRLARLRPAERAAVERAVEDYERFAGDRR